MKLENQCVSLELAKKLEELGFEQESYFYWCKCKYHGQYYFEIKTKKECGNKLVKKRILPKSKCSAFTLAEIGEFFIKGTWLNTFFHSSEVQISRGRQGVNFKSDKNETNARAKMLIYLKENNLI